MTTIQLTTWDRVTIANVIGALQGDWKLTRKAGKILDVIELTHDEREAVNFRYDASVKFAQWDDKDRKWDVTICDPELLLLLRETLRAKDDWMGVQHREVDALYSALGIE